MVKQSPRWLLRADPPAALPNAPASVGPVLVAGEGGYAAFRIPGIVAAGGGAAGRCGPTVLVLVAEGRRFGCDDFDGQHDIVAKRSTDGGRRWGPLQVVADPAKQLNCSLGSLILPRCEFWDPTVLYDSERCETLIMSACESRCFLDLSVLLSGRSPEKCSPLRRLGQLVDARRRHPGPLPLPLQQLGRQLVGTPQHQRGRRGRHEMRELLPRLHSQRPRHADPRAVAVGGAAYCPCL